MKRLTLAAMVLMGAMAMAVSGCQDYSADEEKTMTSEEKTDATVRHAKKNVDRNATTTAKQATQKKD